MIFCILSIHVLFFVLKNCAVNMRLMRLAKLSIIPNAWWWSKILKGQTKLGNFGRNFGGHFLDPYEGCKKNNTGFVNGPPAIALRTRKYFCNPHNSWDKFTMTNKKWKFGIHSTEMRPNKNWLTVLLKTRNYFSYKKIVQI